MITVYNLQEMKKGEKSFWKYQWDLFPSADDFPTTFNYNE